MSLNGSPHHAKHRLRRAGALLVSALVPLLAALLLTEPSRATPQGEQREVNRTFSAGEGMSVELENLAGVITVEGTSAGDIEVAATIHAESGRRADAQTLLALLDLAFDADGNTINVRARYPVDRYDVYRYPARQRGTSTTRYQGERVRVISRDSNDAVTLYVDFRLRLPPGASAAIDNAVGDVTASGLRGNLAVDSGTGDVRATGGAGLVGVDTGSGDVLISSHAGDVIVDTGSGNVEVRELTGDVNAETGSGVITLVDVEASRIDVDTGSGNIALQGVSGSLSVDTGSGDIEANDLRAGTMLIADTGSGDVTLSGDMSQVEEIDIDTGSGDIELDIATPPGMRIALDTGSGGISVDLPDLQVMSSRRNSFRGESGDGRASVTISTGSGSIRIRAR